MNKDLLVHYWQLPDDIFVYLKDDFHNKLCYKIQSLTKCYRKNCFYKVLNCPKWKAQRLFTKYNRIRLFDLEKLRSFAEINKEEVERNIESIGNYEDGTIIRNPNLPFYMKDIFYVASHLMFDGNYRPKNGCYLLCFGDGLFEYHTERLKIFGDVPTNYIEKEHQLYFSYTIGYICSKLLEIPDFRSMKVFLSDKLKNLCKDNKILLDEFVKAMITDEGAIDDRIRVELGNNEKFIRDIYEVVSFYYELNKIYSRERIIGFENNTKYIRNTKSWRIEFNHSSYILLYISISPLPISYKQENLTLLQKRNKKIWYKRKSNETKKLIVGSLLNKSKSVSDLAKELTISNGAVINHLKGHPTYSDSLIKLKIVDKVEERILNKGGYTKANIYGIIDQEKDYIKND